MQVRPPGIELKTGRKPKMGNIESRKWPAAHNREKITQIFTIFGPLFIHFGPWAMFWFAANFFFHFRLLARFPFYARQPDSQDFHQMFSKTPTIFTGSLTKRVLFWREILREKHRHKSQCPHHMFIKIVQGKQKAHKQDWVGDKILFMCFFRVIPYGGEQARKQNPPKSQDNPVKIFVA